MTLAERVPRDALPPLEVAEAVRHPAPPPRRDLLRAQLPRVMAQDPFLDAFLGIFEDVAATVQDDVASIEHQLDVGLASAEMLRYLGSWLGVDLDPAGDPDRQRELLRAIGPLLGRRGTVRGLEGILSALTGSRCRVRDGGGAWTSAEQVPGPDHRVVVELDHLGDLTGAQVDAFLAAEVPLGVEVDLRVGRS